MWALSVGVALLLGTSVLHAQVRPDSTKRGSPDSVAAAKAEQDSLRARAARVTEDSIRNAAAQARVDSIYRAKLADTIKAQFAQYERPDQAEVTARLQFNRQQILSAGAVNLADLLDRVPGITTFRTGWLAGFHTASFNGDFKRIRVFYDGVERDAIEARNDGVFDFNDIPIWGLESIVVERTASEVRVWLTGWTVRRTTPVTRVDIFTGDLNTNGFRGIFARRFSNGLLFQLVGEQMATQSGRVSAFATTDTINTNGDGNGQMIDLRLGWASRKWTIDVTGTGIARDRDEKQAREGFANLPAFKGARREGYARIAYGDSARGLWTQALIGVLRTKLQGIPVATTGEVSETDSTEEVISSDSIRGRTQQILAIGYRAAWWHASIVDRARPVNGTSYHAPAARVGIGSERLMLSGYGEKRALDSLTQFEGSAVARPIPWLALVANGTRRTHKGDSVTVSTTSVRAEGAVRFKGLWLGGGVVRDGLIDIATPILLGAPAAVVRTGAATGILGNVHGTLYKDLLFDVQAVSWNADQYARPKLRVRTELALVSNWLTHFPKGQFSINARVTHELRDPVPFYWTTGTAITPRSSEPSQVVTGLLEIRIQSATIFYQYRNITGQAYEQIPGFTMPPAVQMYGMRWEFWN